VLELFFASADEALATAESLRALELTVELTAYEGGHALAVSGPPAAIEELYRRLASEWRSQEPRTVTGSVRWWKDEKGYGRITGDDGYIYFCHFSAVQIEGYKTLRPGQRVEFERVERMAAHGRAGAANVRVIGD
jgi:CspA family cold shock protein